MNLQRARIVSDREIADPNHLSDSHLPNTVYGIHFCQPALNAIKAKSQTKMAETRFYSKGKIVALRTPFLALKAIMVLIFTAIQTMAR